MLVQRANVVLNIKEDVVDKYLAKGYSVIDEKGNVVKTGEPKTIEQFQSAYNEQRRLNDKLISENKKLKEEIEKLKSTTLKETKKPSNRTKKVQ